MHQCVHSKRWLQMPQCRQPPRVPLSRSSKDSTVCPVPRQVKEAPLPAATTMASHTLVCTVFHHPDAPAAACVYPRHDAQLPGPVATAAGDPYMDGRNQAPAPRTCERQEGLSAYDTSARLPLYAGATPPRRFLLQRSRIVAQSRVTHLSPSW